MKQIEARYRNPKTGYYREIADEPAPVFNWGLGVLLTAQNSLASLDPSYKSKLVDTLEHADEYWNSVGPVPGFDVQPHTPKNQDRYYDDNAWMVMALVDSYEITGDRRWLNRAQDALKHVLSGEDSQLGGGIFWKERERTSKNTCSNAPAAAACLAVYRHTKDSSLMVKAKEIYAWTREKLQAPDHLYWDNIRLDGKIDKTKWSYNAALMLRVAKELDYRQDVEDLERACIKQWVKPDGTIDDELQFAHLLFENLNPAKFDAKKCIERLLDGRDAQGFFGKRWGVPQVGKHQLIHQVSAVRALATYELRLKK